MMKKKAVLIRDVDPELHQKFKAYCVTRNISMQDKVKELMAGCAETITISYDKKEAKKGSKVGAK